MVGGGTRIHSEGRGGEERGRRVRLAAWFFPFALILLSAAIVRVFPTGGVMKGETGNTSSLLGAVSRRPALSFGFRNLLADVTWLEAVQVAGNPRMTSDEYDRLADLLYTVARFDARFVVPYLLGGIVLGDSPHHAGTALDLLAQGARRFPKEWRIPFYIGYIQYFALGNPERGGMALLDAARIPGSPDYFPMLASRMLSEGHRPATALAFLYGMMERETDPLRKSSLEERIRRVEVERDLQLMEGAIAGYISRFGGPPAGLSDLVRSGMLARIPQEPYGGRYLLTPDGGVVSDRAPRERLKVLRSR